MDSQAVKALIDTDWAWGVQPYGFKSAQLVNTIGEAVETAAGSDHPRHLNVTLPRAVSGRARSDSTHKICSAII